jgi:hypothetical protein
VPGYGNLDIMDRYQRANINQEYPHLRRIAFLYHTPHVKFEDSVSSSGAGGFVGYKYSEAFIHPRPSPFRMRPWSVLESITQAPFLQATTAVAAVCFIRILYARYKRTSISSVPGPEKSDLFFGNLTDIYFKEAGEPHIRWQEEYGQVFKVYGLLGVHNFQL